MPEWIVNVGNWICKNWAALVAIPGLISFYWQLRDRGTKVEFSPKPATLSYEHIEGEDSYVIDFSIEINNFSGGILIRNIHLDLAELDAFSNMRSVKPEVLMYVDGVSRDFPYRVDKTTAVDAKILLPGFKLKTSTPPTVGVPVSLSYSSWRKLSKTKTSKSKISLEYVDEADLYILG